MFTQICIMSSDKLNLLVKSANKFMYDLKKLQYEYMSVHVTIESIKYNEIDQISDNGKRSVFNRFSIMITFKFDVKNADEDDEVFKRISSLVEFYTDVKLSSYVP